MAKYDSPIDQYKAQLAIYDKMYARQPLNRFAVIGHVNFNRLGYVEARSLLEAHAIAMLLNLEDADRPVICTVSQTAYHSQLTPYAEAKAADGDCFLLDQTLPFTP